MKTTNEHENHLDMVSTTVQYRIHVASLHLVHVASLHLVHVASLHPSGLSGVL